MGKKTKANQNSTGFCFYFLLFFFSEMKSLDLVINLSNFEKRIGSGRAFLFKFFFFFFFFFFFHGVGWESENLSQRRTLRDAEGQLRFLLKFMIST